MRSEVELVTLRTPWSALPLRLRLTLRLRTKGATEPFAFSLQGCSMKMNQKETLIYKICIHHFKATSSFLSPRTFDSAW